MTSTQPPADPRDTVCANCSAPLEGPYCASCGQSEADLRRPILSLATDFLDGALAWDGRFLTTLRGLYTRPGKVARDYVDGKRMQFSPPVRIYLIMTLVFFAVTAAAGTRPVSIAFTPDAATIRSQSASDIEARQQAWADREARAREAGSGPRFSCGVMPGPDEFAADGSLAFARDTSIDVTLFQRGSAPEGRGLDLEGEACFRAALRAQDADWIVPVVLEAIRHPGAYEARAGAIASQAFLFMVAAFALLNMALHPRRRMIEHVVYSLYWNASMVPGVMLTILVINLGGTRIPSLVALAVIGIATQIFAALQERGFYGSSWLGTALRLPVLMAGYGAGMTMVSIGLIWLGAR
ncbi:DUF3667 domain-containing protein [Maricaulis salignorans]|uniref:DUF3667 domain-containing protein n=1 Tax=Maricaulis salignorans TaxID=144026 RepID=A0A1G9SBN4_9PROT|nr:DUF3667 domain-containing protein [Maricaulis salignorans]SDM32888.1 Protein of unknown function [Maricaulis salignorans]